MTLNKTNAYAMQIDDLVAAALGAILRERAKGPAELAKALRWKVAEVERLLGASSLLIQRKIILRLSLDGGLVSRVKKASTDNPTRIQWPSNSARISGVSSTFSFFFAASRAFTLGAAR